MLDWEKLTRCLTDCHKGGAEHGPSPYYPATLLKILLIAYLYDLSEREGEQYVSDSLAARHFIGIAANHLALDHSSLRVFRERILKKLGTAGSERLFIAIVRLAIKKGIKFGKIQLVVATHTVASVNVDEDKKRCDKGQAPRDPDPSWGSKGRPKVKTSDGTTAEVNKTFHGYKAHIRLSAEAGIVTAVNGTTGRETDRKQFPDVVEKDEKAGVEAEIYTGDKGYDDGENHETLRSKGKQSALLLNKYRTEKKDGNKEIWIEMKASDAYQEGKKERYRVEQKFGEGKRYHGWGRQRVPEMRRTSAQRGDAPSVIGYASSSGQCCRTSLLR